MIQPLGRERRAVLVERCPEQSRIVLTDRDPSRIAKVIAVGPKCTEVKPGDIVCLPGIASTEPDFDFREAILIHEDDIGAKLHLA